MWPPALNVSCVHLMNLRGGFVGFVVGVVVVVVGWWGVWAEGRESGGGEGQVGGAERGDLGGGLDVGWAGRASMEPRLLEAGGQART